LRCGGGVFIDRRLSVADVPHRPEGLDVREKRRVVSALGDDEHEATSGEFPVA
jgi:hypothetical protein